MFKSSLGSCLKLNDETLKLEVIEEDKYYYSCNPAYEVGGTPVNSMILLLIGNIFIIVTLRCHSSWAARINYFITCITCITAASVSPDPSQSTLIILSAFLTVVIYESIENNSLAVFKALLEAETAKRIGMAELKHFIGNVAHDLKTPLHGFSMCVDHLLLDTHESIPDSEIKTSMVSTLVLCQANCSFMTTAVNRTVDFAKAASNIALSAKMETTSVMDAMNWAVTCMNSSQTRLPIRILLLPSNICKFIVTDKHWLMENILCYLSNAVKYSSRGTITMSVCLQEIADNTDEANSSSKKKKKTKKKFSVMGTTSDKKPIENMIDTPPSSPSSSPPSSSLTRKKGIQSLSSSSSSSSSKFMLCFAIEDEGIGIDDDKKLSLFQPFQQTMRLAGGTGLGLYSLAKRIDVLKGNYGVTNRSDGKPGSRFWFTIPYTPDEIYASHCIDSKLSSHSLRNTNGSFDDQSGGGSFYIDRIDTNKDSIGSSSSSSSSNNINKDIPIQDSNIIIEPTLKNSSDSKKQNKDSSKDSSKDGNDIDDSNKPCALVVEDSVVISKATKRMLTKAGYLVDLAENGAIGLEKMKLKVYCFVVMDLQMPIMDGLEATRRIRAFENEPSYIESGLGKQRIIGASANGTDDVRLDAINSGMDSFVSKPFSLISALAQDKNTPTEEEEKNQNLQNENQNKTLISGETAVVTL